MNIGNGMDISNGVDIDDMMDNDVSWIDRLPFTDLNWIKSERRSDHYNMHNIVKNEISFIEEIQPNHFNLNYSKSKSHSDNIVDSNYNVGNRLGNKEL